jgi:universal stress protein E
MSAHGGAEHHLLTMVCKRILFIVDTPEGVRRMLADKVASLARCLGAELEIFDAVFDAALTDAERVHEFVQRRRSELESIVALVREAGVPAHATVLWSYPPRQGIFREMRHYRPDLLIIQSRRHSRLARLLFTYSDYKLIETARCPVLVIKNDRSYANARVVAAVDPSHEHGKPAALDELIVRTGAFFAAAMGRPLHLFHACSPWPPGEVSLKRLRDLPAAVIEDAAGAWQAEAAASVRSLAAQVGCPESALHLRTGNAAAVLPEFVRSSPDDLLVMGAASRSALKKALLGHTAEKVLEETDCDVLVVRLGRQG